MRAFRASDLFKIRSDEGQLNGFLHAWILTYRGHVIDLVPRGAIAPVLVCSARSASYKVLPGTRLNHRALSDPELRHAIGYLRVWIREEHEKARLM